MTRSVQQVDDGRTAAARPVRAGRLAACVGASRRSCRRCSPATRCTRRSSSTPSRRSRAPRHLRRSRHLRRAGAGVAQRASRLHVSAARGRAHPEHDTPPTASTRRLSRGSSTSGLPGGPDRRQPAPHSPTARSPRPAARRTRSSTSSRRGRRVLARRAGAQAGPGGVQGDALRLRGITALGKARRSGSARSSSCRSRWTSSHTWAAPAGASGAAPIARTCARVARPPPSEPRGAARAPLLALDHSTGSFDIQ